MNISEQLREQYKEEMESTMETLLTGLNLEDIQRSVETRVEGMISKAISDRIALETADRIKDILALPDFNKKVQEHVLKLVDNMSQVSFRKLS